MKKIFALATAICLLGIQILPFSVIDAKLAEAGDVEEEHDYYVQTFITSAYYSPLEGQDYYVTGSLAGDIYLNGSGVNSADGTPVYPGMIAAPSTYAFGTKMEIPGVGTVAVHDRGGAILVAGERGYEYDRLDIWMGYGDAGLTRALNWGKRTVDVIVYGINPDIKESVYLEGYSSAESFVRNTVLSPLEFPNDIYYAAEGDDVKEMQEYLIDWGYYENEATGFFGSDTAQAIFQFQLDFGIVDDPEDMGAGHFGINTRTKFDQLINADEGAEEVVKLQKGEVLMAKYVDLYEEKELFAAPLELGSTGNTVSMLQEELVNLGYLRLDPTGYFGETTEHAVFKFQQNQGLVSSMDDAGAGYVGPATRSALNGIIEDRYEMKSYLAYQREEVEQGRHVVKLPQEMFAAVKEEEVALP